MRAPSFLIALGAAALLLGCQSTAHQGPISELPSNNPTTTSTELADQQ